MVPIPVSVSSLGKPTIQHGPLPDQVYRFFDAKEYAEDFSKGIIQLSTLEICRAHERKKQGDSGEATQHYVVNQATGSDAFFADAAARLHIAFPDGPGEHAVVSRCSSTEKIRDGWVLCTTEQPAVELEETFGRYCVRIGRPVRFFESVTAQMCHGTLNLCIERAEIGRMVYRSRKYFDGQEAPGPIGFVKPAEGYEPQREVRMLWVAGGTAPIDKLMVCCPAIARLCTKMF
jgi:hypothetical protein